MDYCGYFVTFGSRYIVDGTYDIPGMFFLSFASRLLASSTIESLRQATFWTARCRRCLPISPPVHHALGLITLRRVRHPNLEDVFFSFSIQFFLGFECKLIYAQCWMVHLRQGFLSSAMKNYLSLLGWNDGTEKEIFTEEELHEAFDLRRVVKSAAVFDMTKLK